MPQMSPMWWTSLMMMFILMFIMCLTMMYFSTDYKMKIKKKMKIMKINWKW
uniref:ATP synthase F0 subunit 8 n=1 Tax=Uzeldikra longiprocessa TaxID=2893152 RepID=A0A9E6XSR0_9HEMI|nr:ATP synthase F0 subunit 8 [Uzeldikra longiprocessa]UGN61293.1 ATP synthase F0 subunit 8 [Uzeldikra longiprocessa]